ncbi:MAG: molybdenum ABC transporter permease subunit [Acidimicrobiia bacterium]|nr:MAG: molybdenum ABC transporter permease subunit [Acidimicrobiia bacterium]
MWDPLWLSLRVALTATVLVAAGGVTLGYMLSRLEFPGRRLLDALATAPIVMPPTVLGYYLLVLLGRRSPIGNLWESVFGGPLVFTWQGAVVAAAVASFPFCLRSVRAAVDSVDRRFEEVGEVMGLSRLGIAFHITLPLARRGIAAGVALAFARALGDFGTTVMVAGNIPGRTQTMPIAIYDAVQAFDYDRAGLLAAVLLGVAVGVLLLVRRMEGS